jgi:hypothetical protein
LVFSPNGVISAAVINAPGAIHDSQIAEWGNIYSKLSEVYKKFGARVIVDSAFSRTEYPFLIKSSQDLPLTSGAAEIIRARQATSARQAAEWGMRAFQGSFPRIKDRLIYEENGERKVILQMMILLFNFRTRLVGLIQILTTYMPRLSIEANYLLENTFQ